MEKYSLKRTSIYPELLRSDNRFLGVDAKITIIIYKGEKNQGVQLTSRFERLD